MPKSSDPKETCLEVETLNSGSNCLDNLESQLDSGKISVKDMPKASFNLLAWVFNLLFILGLPAAMILGEKITNKKKVRVIGLVLVFILCIGRFGVGVQLASAAIFVACVIA